MKSIAIDYGTKNVGVAMSDPEGKVATPHGIIDNDSQLAERIVSLVRQNDVKRIVMGESRTFLGHPNPIMRKVKRFAAELSDRTGIKVEYEPEALTSAQALKARIGANKPTASGRRPSIIGLPRMDDAAATLVLQNYLEKKRHEAAELDTHERKNKK